MPQPSDSDASDSSPPSGLWGPSADLYESDQVRQLYFPSTLLSRRTLIDGTIKKARTDQNVRQMFEKMLHNAPKSDSGGPCTPQSGLVNVALEGMVPVMMRQSQKGDIDAGGSGTVEAEMQTKCPLPPSRTITTTTDPVVKVSWGPDSHVFASGEAIEHLKSLRKTEKQTTKERLKRERVKEESITHEETAVQPAKTEPIDLLIDEIVEVVGDQKIWDLQDIQMRVDRSEPDVLQVLNEVAVMWQNGESLGRWELKPRFKKQNADREKRVAEAKAYLSCQEASAEASEQEHSTVGVAQSAIKDERLPMPPPGTPRPELNDPTHGENQAILKHSLSTPTLPAFHSVSDPVLVAACMAERAHDPITFDKRTAEIKDSLTAAKIRRGGSNFLTQGDYTVELASREDAAKVEKWKHGEKSLEGIDENEEERLGERDSRTSKVRRQKQKQKQKQTHRKPKERGVHRDITPAVLANFELSDSVCKYTTSGTLRQQCSRQVEDDETGKTTTYTTWIEIKQDVFVPTAKDVAWVDVREAMKQAKARKKEEKRGEIAEKANTDAGDGKGLDRKKHIRKQSSKDANADESLSLSDSEDHDGWCPQRRSQKKRRAEIETEKAMAARRDESAERELGRKSIDAAEMVGELVTAIDRLQDGKAEASANSLDAISEQMFQMAKLLDQNAELGTDRLAADVVEG